MTKQTHSQTLVSVPPPFLSRLVIVERGAMRGRESRIARPNQRLIAQAPDETDAIFLERLESQISRGPSAYQGLFLLGDGQDLESRRQLVRRLAAALVPSSRRMIEVSVSSGGEQSMAAWELLDSLRCDPALHGVELRLKLEDLVSVQQESPATCLSA